MAEITTTEIREYISKIQGHKTSLREIREEFNIVQGSKSFDAVRNILFQLAEQRVVVALGQGQYKVVTEVYPVKVYGRERRPPVEIYFPRDFDTWMEMPFAEDIILREGDLILIAGRSNFGKTTLCMNWLAENIDRNPVLMGNEYTTLDREPSPRFLNRLDTMDWVQWVNGNGEDRFTLLPVFEDYAEHTVRNRLNIIDWINIDASGLYNISKVMENIKRALGKGIGIIALQKGENASAGRGGQFTKDFADVEILLDEYGSHETMITLGKVKESKRRVSGRHYAFGISEGVKIIGLRELKRCKACYGKGWRGVKPCDECNQTGWVDTQ